jgi:hypothetical protein
MRVSRIAAGLVGSAGIFSSLEAPKDTSEVVVMVHMPVAKKRTGESED